MSDKQIIAVLMACGLSVSMWLYGRQLKRQEAARRELFAIARRINRQHFDESTNHRLNVITTDVTCTAAQTTSNIILYSNGTTGTLICRMR